MRRREKGIAALAAAMFLTLGQVDLVRAWQWHAGSASGPTPLSDAAVRVQDGIGTTISVRQNYITISANLTSGLQNDSNKLIRGVDLYNEVHTGDGDTIRSSYTTAQNLAALDTAIQQLKTYKATGAGSIIVTEGTNEEGRTTYTIAAREVNVRDANDIGLLKSSDAYSELRAGGTYIKADATTAANLTELDKQIKLNADEIPKLQNLEGLTETGELNIKKYAQAAVQVRSGNPDAITVVGTTDTETGNRMYTITAQTGGVTKNAKTLLTGGTAYGELREEAEGTYVHKAQTTAENLNALDTQVKANTDDITLLKKDMSNLTETGIQNVKNLAQGAVKVASGTDSIIITPGSDDAVTGDKVYKIQANPAEMRKGNTGLVTAGKAYTEFRAEGRYIRADQTVAQNLGTLDTQIKANADGLIALEKRIGNKLDVLPGRIMPLAAGAAALAALQPEAYNPEDRWSFAVGYGHYRSANATALGVFFKPEAAATFSVGGTVWSDDPMLHMGASFQLGRAKKTKMETQAAAERVQALEEGSGEETAVTAKDEMTRVDGEQAAQARRLAILEAHHKVLAADRAARLAALHTQEQELAQLRAARETIKAERAGLEKQMAELLHRVEKEK